jgi:TorA maturation chaperone TorD
MVDSTPVDETELLRAHCYSLLGQLLARPPSRALLDGISGLRSDESPLGRAFADLGAAAGTATEENAEIEYNRLFVGLVRGELLPYGSYYLTGFLHERPLVRLRHDMQALGIVRTGGVSEPEDHIASLCEMMAGLIVGRFGAPTELPRQQRFFERHLAPWAGRFFEDLEHAAGAVLYRPVGTIGRIFLEIESDAFAFNDIPAEPVRIASGTQS